MRLKELLEPEETVGTTWHGLVAGRRAACRVFPRRRCGSMR